MRRWMRRADEPKSGAILWNYFIFVPNDDFFKPVSLSGSARFLFMPHR
jgi:hypothetical protein